VGQQSPKGGNIGGKINISSKRMGFSSIKKFLNN
jgi:hypothetical protein